MLELFLTKVPEGRSFSVEARKRPGREVIARWPWWHSKRPDRRFKRAMLNCYLWKIVWLDDES